MHLSSPRVAWMDAFDCGTHAQRGPCASSGAIAKPCNVSPSTEINHWCLPVQMTQPSASTIRGWYKRTHFSNTCVFHCLSDSFGHDCTHPPRPYSIIANVPVHRQRTKTSIDRRVPSRYAFGYRIRAHRPRSMSPSLEAFNDCWLQATIESLPRRALLAKKSCAWNDDASTCSSSPAVEAGILRKSKNEFANLWMQMKVSSITATVGQGTRTMVWCSSGLCSVRDKRGEMRRH